MDGQIVIHDHSHDHDHDDGRIHDHDHDDGRVHDHDHDEGRVHHHHRVHGSAAVATSPPTQGKIIRLDQAVLAKNDQLAERNRGWFAGRNILALNLVSSPGSGKTTLLERTLRELGGELEFHVIEGDQATTLDAERIRSTGCRVVQVNTGAGCHLEADMLARGLQQLDPPMNAVVMIENVGNLVCPALFDLGERAKIVVASITEGEDKPIKYPHMFRASQLLLLNKIDLLPHLDFDVARFLDYAHQVNPLLKVLEISAKSGEGMKEWYDWLRVQSRQRPQLADPVFHQD
jgi:hydrogenase nickel incorporation protein HypB